jgi:hypothetical protein
MFMRCFPACLVLLLSGAALAQSFIVYVDREQRFSVNLPAQPRIEQFRYIHLDDEMVPARRYTAERDGTRFIVTVVDMTGMDNVSRVRGSIAHEAWSIRKRVAAKRGEIIYDAYSQISRIEGHQIQARYPDGSLDSWQLLIRDKRFYIQEADVPAGAPPPGLFLASLWILDENGKMLRPTIDFNGQVTKAGTADTEGY